MLKVGDKVLIRATVEHVDGNIVTVRPCCGDESKKHDTMTFEACFCECDEVPAEEPLFDEDLTPA